MNIALYGLSLGITVEIIIKFSELFSFVLFDIFQGLSFFIIAVLISFLSSLNFSLKHKIAQCTFVKLSCNYVKAENAKLEF